MTSFVAFFYFKKCFFSFFFASFFNFFEWDWMSEKKRTFWGSVEKKKDSKGALSKETIEKKRNYCSGLSGFSIAMITEFTKIVERIIPSKNMVCTILFRIKTDILYKIEWSEISALKKKKSFLFFFSNICEKKKLILDKYLFHQKLCGSTSGIGISDSEFPSSSALDCMLLDFDDSSLTSFPSFLTKKE